MVAHVRDYGYARLTIERVSAESGVAKTTIYRRWRSKAEMVFDLAIHRQDQEIVDIDTGSFAGDVRLLAERAVALVARPPGRDVLPGLLADMAGDGDLAARLRERFVGPARDEIERVMRRAVERKELQRTFDVDDFHATLLGAPYARVTLLGTAATRRAIDQLAAQLLSLARHLAS